ncbi:syndetin-like isoform X4 [Mytilus galloprovincialis]|uniref:syndetin-like isoform X1 n=1 Tax=Mytilus galloprovincialis TaxID=29158 RepID=UPI003F7C38A6
MSGLGLDIKKKFKSLIGKQDSFTSPVEEQIDRDSFPGDLPAVTKYKHTVLANPHEEQEVLEGIENIYYSHTDTSLYELEKLPEVLDLQDIDADRNRLRKQLNVVSKKVSDLVLQNHPAYARELQRVMELEKTLQLASVICANGRRNLSDARQTFTSASLKMLANVRKRQQLTGLLKSLRTIKTLQRTDLRLREMLEEEDYCGAIQLCLECQQAASTYRHFKCISELNSKLQDTLVMIEEQLDVALSKTCSNFDVVHYEKVQKAYRLLNKTQLYEYTYIRVTQVSLQTAMDQLHMHFTSAIHNTAFTIVLGYVELCSGTTNSNFHKRQYTDLCKNVTQDSFTPCLIDLCKALWEVMKSYFKTMQWHEQNDINVQDKDETEEGTEEIAFNKKYIKQKLDHGLTRIWMDVQQKVKLFVLGTDLSHFKLEEFIRVLDIIHRMIEIGEEFCGSKSDGLQDSLKQQSLNYFKNHHRYRMDELRMFLENEGWELCPVKTNFTYSRLLEFKFMKHWNKSPELSPRGDSSLTTDNKVVYFKDFTDGATPFDVHPEDDENEDVFSYSFDSEGNDSDSDSDIPDELKQDYIDEITGEARSHRQYKRRISHNRSRKNVPIVTNTTINLLRVIGKYMKMITVLKPIAFDVIYCISQLFDYYLYTVYSFFGSHDSVRNERAINQRLHLTLQRIHSNVIAEEVTPGAPPVDSEENQDRVPQPHLSPVVDLTAADKLFGLSERVVAAESLVFLANQFEQLQPHFETMIPTNKKAFLQQFYSQTISIAAELRKPVYWAVSVHAIDYNGVINLMANVRWDIKDIMSQHNAYVDDILKKFENLNRKLSDISRRLPIPRVVYTSVWEHCVRLTNRILVEGYSNAKKCSNEGRAFMQLDFQQLLSNLEKMIDLRPIPEKEFVEGYIKAYYLPESQFDSWLLDHKEYSPKQLIALINSVDHLNKKARQRLITVIEDMERTRR